LRLRRGTYVPHIVEHVALELESLIDHDVGYGRARGGDRPGEYTVVFEHLHGEVGRRSALLAVELVTAAFGGRWIQADRAVEELRRVWDAPDPTPPVRQHVACGVIGGGNRMAVRSVAAANGAATAGGIIDLPPDRVLREGLPYASSETAVILDLQAAADLPERYRDPARVRRLCSVVADGVAEGGWIVIPAGDAELGRIASEAGLRAATFGAISGRASSGMHAQARDGNVTIEEGRSCVAEFQLDPDLPENSQLAGALATRILGGAR
jgi:hypothetical protein